MSDPTSEPRSEPKPLALLNRSLVVTTVLAALIVAAAFWLGARNKSDDDWVLHSLEVRAQLTRVLSLVQSAETGQRGYLLTGRTFTSDPIRWRSSQLPASCSARRIWSSDNPEQIKNLAQLASAHQRQAR